jgi:hypothetical protein
MVTDMGSKLGWGKGEISGMMNNFKSVSAIFAPTLFSSSFTAGGDSFPGAPMFTAAATTLASEALYQRMLATDN